MILFFMGLKTNRKITGINIGIGNAISGLYLYTMANRINKTGTVSDRNAKYLDIRGERFSLILLWGLLISRHIKKFMIPSMPILTV